MTDIDARMLDRELKKGSAELIILSIVESRARHGYEISKLIEARSDGRLKFHVASLYPLLYRLEERGWLRGRWVEKAGERRRRFYSLTAEGRRVLARQRKTWKAFVHADGPRHGSRQCLSGTTNCGERLATLRSARRARRRSSRSCPSISISATRSCVPPARATPTHGAWRRWSSTTPMRSPATCVSFARRTFRRRPRPACQPAGRGPAELWHDLRYAARTLRRQPGLRGRRDPDARARHRREQRDLRPRRRDACSVRFRSATRIGW